MAKEDKVVTCGDVATVGESWSKTQRPFCAVAILIYMTVLSFVSNHFILPQNTLELFLKLEEMSVEMNQQCEGTTAPAHHPRRGELCIAKFVKGNELSDFKCGNLRGGAL